MRIRELTARRDATQAQQDELKAQDKTQHSAIDPNVRLLRKYGQCTAGYNVQIATDARHKLIVADAVVNEPNDLRQPAPLAQEAQGVLESQTLEAVADAGYYSADPWKPGRTSAARGLRLRRPPRRLPLPGRTDPATQRNLARTIRQPPAVLRQLRNRVWRLCAARALLKPQDALPAGVAERT
jgi:hypothetical protein